jgi:hypothetical protein
VVESEGKSERVECDENGSCDWGVDAGSMRDCDGAKGKAGQAGSTQVPGVSDRCCSEERKSNAAIRGHGR